ncbi:hypothetical protein [Seonamhaeicola sp.]|uniref:hypothetical protein n=1 Tax=Seonamhaeicola sp. TaxID=1912245 RepID=UPI002604D193|nr:hypothetical protein [Seonamhaeicola sp.]
MNIRKTKSLHLKKDKGLCTQGGQIIEPIQRDWNELVQQVVNSSPLGKQNEALFNKYGIY